MKSLIVIKGGGDLATGIAHRLYRSKFNVVITEIEQPTVIRRTVAFAQAIFSGQMTVEGVTAQRAVLSEVSSLLERGVIPVLIDPQAHCLAELNPQGLVDAIIAKKNTGTHLQDAPVVVGVGPGFTAGTDVHAVVETARGHYLGRVYYHGSAQDNTGIPGEIGGYTIERLVRAPGGGVLSGCAVIGSQVTAGDTIAMVGDKAVLAPISGMLRGLLQNGLIVHEGMKIGDIDPRGEQEHCFTISDKARSIGGGVLEALLHGGITTWH